MIGYAARSVATSCGRRRPTLAKPSGVVLRELAADTLSERAAPYVESV
jgi:hypothetical protein